MYIYIYIYFSLFLSIYIYIYIYININTQTVEYLSAPFCQPPPWRSAQLPYSALSANSVK